MITYLVNSTLCSALLLAVYHLLLKNKAMYNFNRFYLLAGILFSYTVPLITVKQDLGPLPSLIPASTQQPVILSGGAVAQNTLTTPAAITPTINDRFDALVAVYGLIALILLIRLVKNLNEIRLTISQNEKISYRGAFLVLINRQLTPHTFLNYIFLNKEDFEQKKIEDGILQHELAHAGQYHSADIILMEIVQALCWFNPVIFLYRRAIRINHEFIADAVVLHSNDDCAAYQRLLLGTAAQLKSLTITSQFNYSITKKRLIMMTKTTSATSALLSRLAIVPVIAAAFILFCNKTYAQQQQDTSKPIAHEKPKAQDQPIANKQNNGRVMVRFDGRKYPSTVNGISATELAEYEAYETKYTTRRLDLSKTMTKPEEQRLEYLFQHMSLAQQRYRTIIFDYPPAPVRGTVVTTHELASWADPAVYGVWLNGKRIKNADLKNIDAKNINKIFFSRLMDNAVKHDGFHYQVELMTLTYYKSYREKAIANRNNSMIMFHLKS